jgi:predicted nucleic acid-binding protein
VTNSLFFDTDCVSAFLRVNEQRLLSQLYPDRVVIPKPVYNELSYVPHLKQGVDSLINNHKAKLEHLNVDTELYNLYHKLTRNPDPGYKVIGAGEAASIAMAKIYVFLAIKNSRGRGCGQKPGLISQEVVHAFLRGTNEGSPTVHQV